MTSTAASSNGEAKMAACVVMADLDDRRQPGEAEPPAQLVLEPHREEHDAAVLRRVRARPQQAEAGGQVAQDGLGERPAQLPRVPGRRHDIDVVDAGFSSAKAASIESRR
jgi:hypothetical protein